MRFKSAVVGAALMALIAASAAAADYHPPRTAQGVPDLDGAWTNYSLTSLERPAGVGPRVVRGDEALALERRLAEARSNPKGDAVGNRPSEWWEDAQLARVDGGLVTSWILSPEDGKLPYSDQGRRRLADRHVGADNPEDRPTSDRCLTAGWGAMSTPMLNSNYSANYQIVQTAHEVAILSEMNHDVRIIRLGGTHPPKSMRFWMGDSIGHWEGDTLVAETTNFHAGESFRSGYYLSADAVVTERFTRTSPSQIRYRFTIDDPAIYTQPWTGEMPFNASKAAMFEFACHEGNYGLEGILAGARQEEAAQARLAKSAAP